MVDVGVDTGAGAGAGVGVGGVDGGVVGDEGGGWDFYYDQVVEMEVVGRMAAFGAHLRQFHWFSSDLLHC